MSTPKVSCIIVTRDRADLISRSLSTIQAQDFPAEDYEVLVVDDSFNSDTETVVHQFPFVRYIHQSPQLGFYEVSKCALHHAKADIVAFIGDDDEITPNYISTLYSELLDSSISAAYSRAYRVNHSNTILLSSENEPKLLLGGHFGFLAHFLQNPNERLARYWGMTRKHLMQEALALPYLPDEGRPALGRDFMMLFHYCMNGRIAYNEGCEYRFLVHDRQYGRNEGRFGVLAKQRFNIADNIVGYAYLVDRLGELIDSRRYGDIPVVEKMVFNYELWRWYSQYLVSLQTKAIAEHADGFDFMGMHDISQLIRNSLESGGVKNAVKLNYTPPSMSSAA